MNMEYAGKVLNTLLKELHINYELHEDTDFICRAYIYNNTYCVNYDSLLERYKIYALKKTTNNGKKYISTKLIISTYDSTKIKQALYDISICEIEQI